MSGKYQKWQERISIGNGHKDENYKARKHFSK